MLQSLLDCSINASYKPNKDTVTITDNEAQITKREATR